jgi:hypothetical protein
MKNKSTSEALFEFKAALKNLIFEFAFALGVFALLDWLNEKINKNNSI